MPDHRPEPRLRWHTEMVTRAPIFVVPGDSSSSAAVKPMGRTWGMRVSGDVDKLVAHSYRCPVHGVFERRVPLSNVPDEMACGYKSLAEDLGRANPCGLTSPWAGAACAIGWEPGTVTG